MRISDWRSDVCSSDLFPLHGNSEEAAKAAEAAAEQGKFEEMYDLLFQNQAQWSHSEESKKDVFFDYAEQLGLDMDEFRTTYDDPATLEKIRRSEEHTSELQSLMRISSAVFCLKKQQYYN